MNVKMMKGFLVLLLMCIAVLFAAGCTAQDEGAPAVATEKKVELVITPYDTEISSGNVIKKVLAKAGYDIGITTVDVGLAFQGIASGSGDFFVGAWLPTCHGQYYDKYKDEMTLVRENMEGTRCGLAVPSYVEIDSIEELNEYSDMFDLTIVGIEPGAGIMKGTETAIDEYGLDLDLSSGSEVAMCAALKDAIDNGDWIVVTAWSPHWKFVKWDLKYLDDPKNVYGGIEHITTFTRLGLEEDMPELYSFLERFHWDSSDMESIMLDMQEGMTAEEAAAKWVDANPEKVNEWLGDMV